MPMVPRPPLPTNPNDLVEMEDYKADTREWREDNTLHKKANDTTYAKLLGQCSQTVRDRMVTYPQWAAVKNSLDVIGLAKLIQVLLYSGPAIGESEMTYVEAEDKLLNFKQKGRLTNATYCEKFKNKVQVFKHLGGTPGITQRRVDDQLGEDGIAPIRATNVEKKQAEEKVEQKYLANLFLSNSHSHFKVYLAKLKFKNPKKNQLSDT
mmetsp:Transcript_14901/g.22754  ORF Transcript_14901/g.22754 Transcript_14901/m.22754 type:complete len:208 (-) Transcript_14901:394-1017(-)